MVFVVFTIEWESRAAVGQTKISQTTECGWWPKQRVNGRIANARSLR